MADDRQQFERRNQKMVAEMGRSDALTQCTRRWFDWANSMEYSYHFKWLGVPIIQYPQDIVAMQELVWQIQPDWIIETGVARGGSIILYASMCRLIGRGHVIGIDIDIRPHNRQVIESHPLAEHVTLIEGSSVEPETFERVRQTIGDTPGRVLVVLDSMHTHDHVLAELEAYAPLVSAGSYCVVFDTIIEDMPAEMFPDRPWGPGNNPKTAVWEYLKNHPEFAIDKSIQHKLQITAAPDGYLKCVKE